MSKCIITGCRLVLEGEGKSLWGDLHSVGDALVFSGVTIPGNTARLAQWEYVFPAPDKDERQVIAIKHADYFEQRGIVTIKRDSTFLNDAAAKYLGDR